MSALNPADMVAGTTAEVAAGFLDGLAAGIRRGVQLVPLACAEPAG